MVAALCLLAGCGGSSTKTVTRTQTVTVPAPFRTGGAPHGELLSIPAVGRIYARCNPTDRRWTIRLLNDSPATDGVAYRVGSDRARDLGIEPGHALTLSLVPSQFTSHEPADPASRFPAQTLKTTAPISLDIKQGTEPHIYRIKVRFAVAAAIGGTTNCALISSTISAATYYPGGQPPS